MNPKMLKNFLIVSNIILAVVIVFLMTANNRISKELASKETSELLALQEKCSHQAKIVASSPNHRAYGTASISVYQDHQSHYNPSLKKCFVLIKNSSDNQSGYLSYSNFLIDAFENRNYGAYLWTKEQGKGSLHFGTNPYVCKITPSISDEKICTSLSEFQSLIKPYLE